MGAFVAQPDFSEFTFGYSVTRHFEEVYDSRRVLPNFPTQPEEADGGYDVDFLEHGVPLFIQFKRSEVMTRRSAVEWKHHPTGWSLPIYRMHLHGHNEYRQHYLMQNLEDEGNVALYVTSQVPTKAALNAYYQRDQILEASRMFLPSEIHLPNINERHHVSFNRGTSSHHVFSAFGIASEGRIRTEQDFVALLRERAGKPPESARESLVRFVQGLSERTADGVAKLQRERRPFEVDAPYNSPQDDLFYASRQEEEAVARVAGAPRSLTTTEFYRRLNEVESVVRRAAIAAYHEADAYLLSVSRSALE